MFHTKTILILLFFGMIISSLAESASPNILFILADDQRWDELACEGEPYLQTPNIDRLASEGVRFSQTYVNTPICMASRATIFSGLTARTHQWTPGNPDAQPLDDQILKTCFPVLLKQNGYRTGFFGKNHANFSAGTQPAFDTMFDDWEIISRNPAFKKLSDGTLRHFDEILGDRAVSFVETQPTDQPFFLYMSFHIAHASDGDRRPGIGHYPWPKEEDGLYEDIIPPRPVLDDPSVFNALPEFLKKSLNRTRYFWRWDTEEKYTVNMRARYRMITGMDRIIGRVLAALRERGLENNTVVIYSADNGYYRGERGLAGKWSHFEESLHVPLIIRCPEMKKELRGKKVDALASNIDFPYTILDLAGIPVPGSYQGSSLVPFLNGMTPDHWRTDIFCEHYQFGTVIPAWSGVHGSRYVYACYDTQNPPYEFLHDLKMDPKQLTNFVDNPEYTSILKEMRESRNEYIRKYTADREHGHDISCVSENHISDNDELTFEGNRSVLLGHTPELLPEDPYRWAFDVKISPKYAPGAVLMGNRKTPEESGLVFMKITSDKGVQFFSKGQRLVLDAKIPRNRWVRVELRKTSGTVTLFLDGEPVATGSISFALPSMPCYLGGDPAAPNEYSFCIISNASAISEL